MSIRSSKVYFLPVVLMAFSFSAQAAPVAPDAGQVSRELQRQPELVPPPVAEPLIPESSTAPEPEGKEQVRFAVTTIRVTGSSAFAASELEALVADLSGGEHSLAELEAGAGRITAHYRSRGYLVARAYLPAQDIKDGLVTISVLEGLLGERRTDNRSLLSDDAVGSYLDGIRRGEALQTDAANRALLLLNDTPGVGSARASLQPGASAGTSDLVVELTPSAPYSANIELDNIGNRYTGEHRLGVDLMVNSPLRLGDQVGLSALTTDQHLNYTRLAWQVPAGSSGLRIGAAYANTRYQLGKEFAMLQAHGSAANTSLYAMYPFIRSQTGNLMGIAMWERKKLNDSMDAVFSSSDKEIRLGSLGLAGNLQNAQGGTGITSFDLTLASGNLNMDAASLLSDVLSQSSGAFTRMAFNLGRLQSLTAGDTLSLALSGQKASKNLNTSEKIYLGGAQSVRAYPQGEEGGDEGYLATLELRHDYTQDLQALLFYDAGTVKINRDPYAAGANTRHLAGAGAGVDATLAGTHVRASVAWRTRGGAPLTEPTARNPRLWLQAGKQF